jgi:MFS family permease
MTAANPVPDRKASAKTGFQRRGALHRGAEIDARSFLVVLVATAVLFTNNGFIFVGVTFFDPMMLDRLGVSVGVLKTRDAVTLITAAIASPFSGYLIDRIGVRPVMAVGMALMAVGMAAYPEADNLMEIYAIHVVFGLCLVMAGLYVCIILVAGVTDRNRGIAVGAVLAGSSLGQAVSPGLNALLVGPFGWENTFRADGILPLLLVPVVLAVVPKRRAGPQSDQTVSAAPGGPTYGEALRSRNFWLLASLAMVTFFVELGVATNLVLYVQRQLHLPSDQANGAVFCLFVTALISQLGSGFVADRFGTIRVHFICIILMGLGLAVLAAAGASFLLVGAAVFGIGWGGNYAAIQITISKLFNGRAVGRILGTNNVIESVGAGLGPSGIGFLYDLTHDYAVPFAGAAAVVLLMSMAVLLIRPLRHAVV